MNKINNAGQTRPFQESLMLHICFKLWKQFLRVGGFKVTV